MPTPVKRVIVCADDFARDGHVNAAILKLVALGRLSAVSCFTDSASWRYAGPELLAGSARTFLGLHFNLTEPFGQGERPLARWIARCLVGSVDRVAVQGHLQRQFDRFVAVIGRPPDFIDGHQHVHAFPVIRPLVDEFIARLGGNQPVQVRALAPSFGRTDAPFKRSVIQGLATLGGQPYAPPLNPGGFAGDYSLGARADYESLFGGWLAEAPDGGLIMCHPASGARKGHGIASQREYRFLASSRYDELLAACGCTLARRRHGVQTKGS